MTDTNNFQRVLAVETATRHQAIALLDGEVVLEHRVQRVRYNHGSSLLQNIDALFSAQALSLADVDLFAVGLGPGSFTGLRVGLATLKALARTQQKPIVGVSSLAAMAYVPALTNKDATILASFDARRREIYAGAYGVTSRGFSALIEDCATAPKDWIESVKSQVQGPLLDVGEGRGAYSELAHWQEERLGSLSLSVAPPSAVGVALLGRQKAVSDGPDNLIELEPNYIRPSDARLPDRQFRAMPPEPAED